MPDITMCTGVGCPQRDQCYRATVAPLEHRQSYFQTPPVQADGTCAYFSPADRRYVAFEVPFPSGTADYPMGPVMFGGVDATIVSDPGDEHVSTFVLIPTGGLPLYSDGVLVGYTIKQPQLAGWRPVSLQEP